VLLKDESGDTLALDVCHSVCPKLVVGNEGPLGPNKVAVQITDVLVMDDRTTNWMFTLRAWKISHAFYVGASLYDHDQIGIYRKAMEDWNSKRRPSARPYDCCGRSMLPVRITKAKRLLSMEDINLVASKICCKFNCIQPYPREKIFALRNQM
jgi:hypothetical protein